MANFIDSIDTKEAMLLFHAGSLDSCVAVQVPLQDDGEWMLLLNCKKRSEPYKLSAQREPIRRFKSADGVIKTALKIGFKSIRFEC
jgi:hypothetical protein